MSRSFHLLVSHVVPVHIGRKLLVLNEERAVGVQSKEICCPFDKLFLCFSELGKSDEEINTKNG